MRPVLNVAGPRFVELEAGAPHVDGECFGVDSPEALDANPQGPS